MSEAGSQYDIIQKIGQGGMGTVYLASDRMLDRQVAIKQLNRSSEAVDEGMGDRFQQEALALARLNHPNITHLYAFIPRGDTYWMVMEFVEGKTLEEWLQLHKKISPVLAASLAVQLLDGLQHAHRKGIIHRDIKPANIMINEEGEVKIMDFGIARMRHVQRMTRHGKSVGTLEYMAPEQIQGQEGDERTDVYAVGNLLYEMLTGRPPFQSDTDYILMKEKLEKQPEALTRYSPAASPALQRVILKALEREPDRRYQTAAALKEAISKAMEASLLPKEDLTRLLKASQEMTAAHAGNEPFSVSTLLARARKLSGGLAVPGLGKQNRPYVLLAVSVILCALLLWSQSGEEPVAEKKPADALTREQDFSSPPPEEVATAGSSSFSETPNEMYHRISAQPHTEEKNTEKKAPKKKETSARETAVKDAEKKEHQENHEAASSREPVDVPAGRQISVSLAEDLSSEQEERDGSQVKLVCSEDVMAGGRVIIRKGAPVTGKIVDVIPSGNERKKALIGFIIQQVQAVDGSMIRLHSDRFRLFSDAPGSAVSYRKGQRFHAELKRGRVR